MCAYTEVLHRFPDHESIIMVSLGTGELTRRLPYDEVKGWGAARWAQPTFAMMCDGICDVVDYQLQQLLPSTPEGMRQYYRFQARLDVGRLDLHHQHAAEDRGRRSIVAPAQLQKDG